MPFLKYVPWNNAQGNLLAGISAWSVTMILEASQGWRFPTTFPFLCEIKQNDVVAPYAVLKREIVKVTGRTGDTLTIVRSSGTCLPNDASNTPGTTAFSFSTGDTVTLTVTAETIKDIQDEVSTKLASAGGLRTGFWANKWLILNAGTGAEEVKTVTNSAVPIDTDTFRLIDISWNFQDVTYLELRTDISTLVANTFLGTSNDTLVTNSPACIWYDWNIYNIPTTNMGSFTQINAGWVWTFITQRYLGNNTYLFGYMRSTTVYARAATLIDNVWTYWTEVTLRSGMTANTIVLSAVMNTNKVIIGWYETSTSIGYIVCTVSWVTTSIWSVVTQTTWGSGTGNMYMEKIDIDRFIVVLNSGADSRYMIGTVSGTVPSPWAYTVIGTNTGMDITFLANWYAGIMFQSGTTIAHRIIYSASWTTTTTTYTLADTSAVSAQGAICRLDNTSYAYYNGGTTVTKITIPWAGTTLVSSSMVTWLSAIVNCAMVNIADWIFALLSTTTGYIFQWAKTLLTFSSVGILATAAESACNVEFDGKYVMYLNSSSANGIPSYLSILENQIIWAIQNNSPLVLLNGPISVSSWLKPWSKYYSWNPITSRPKISDVEFGIALSATKLLIK